MLLSHTPARIVKEWLVASALAGDDGNEWVAFHGTKPATPDLVVVVWNYFGRLDARLMAGEFPEHFGIQIYFRGLADEAMAPKMKEVEAALAAVRRTPVVVEDTFNYLFHSWSRTSSLIPMGEEENNKRRQFTLNGLVVITET